MQRDRRILGEGIAHAEISIVVHWQILVQWGVVREPRLASDTASASNWCEICLGLIVHSGFNFGCRLRPFQLLCQSFDAIFLEIKLLGSWRANNHSGASPIAHGESSHILVIIAPCAPFWGVLQRLSGGLHYASLVCMFPILQICPILSEQDVIREGLKG
jgi:hypothetical protein